MAPAHVAAASRRRPGAVARHDLHPPPATLATPPCSPIAIRELTLPLSLGGGGRGAQDAAGVGGAGSTVTAPTMGSTGLRQNVQDGVRHSSLSPADGKADTWAGPSSDVGAMNPPPAGFASEAGDRPTTPVVVAVVQADPGLADPGELDAHQAGACSGRRQPDHVALSETNSDAGKVRWKAPPSPEKMTRNSRATPSSGQTAACVSTPEGLGVDVPEPRQGAAGTIGGHLQVPTVGALIAAALQQIAGLGHPEDGPGELRDRAVVCFWNSR
jgi:hypothetical protein